MFLVASITPSGRCSASSGAGNGCTGARGGRAAPRADLQLSIFMPMMIPTINMTAKPTTATAAPLESAGVAGLHCALMVTSISATEPCHIKAAMHSSRLPRKRPRRTKCIIATPTSTSGCAIYIYICALTQHPQPQSNFQPAESWKGSCKGSFAHLHRALQANLLRKMVMVMMVMMTTWIC